MTNTNVIQIPNFDKIAHYPKTLAAAENIGNIRNAHFENNAELPEYLQQMAVQNKESFTRSYFEYFGAYPYIFEAISYALTQTPHELLKQKIKPTQDGLFFEMRFKWETFLDYALDGMKGQTAALTQTLYDLALHPQGKVISISPTQTVTTTPLRITLIHKNGFEMNEQEIKRLSNLKQNRQLENTNISPIAGIYIECFTPFFADLLQNTDCGNWFPIPKAFYAKMIDTQTKYRNDPEISKINVTGNASTYRKLFLYMFMHDNNIGKQLNFDAIKLWKSVSPSEIKYIKDKTGNEKAYLRRAEKSRLFFYKANLLLNRMAKEGYLTGVQFAPNKVWLDYNKQVYTVFLNRVPEHLKSYTQIETMIIDDPKLLLNESEIEEEK